jgi:hypothetical protein
MEASMGQYSELAPMGFPTGEHHGNFTTTEERAISDHIIDTDMTPGRFFIDATFVEVAGQLLPPRRESMKQYAEDLGIHLFSYLPGLIDEMQPLNRFVFGVMKAQGRQMYRNHAMSFEPIGDHVA